MKLRPRPRPNQALFCFAARDWRVSSVFVADAECSQSLTCRFATLLAVETGIPSKCSLRQFGKKIKLTSSKGVLNVSFRQRCDQYCSVIRGCPISEFRAYLYGAK